MNRLLVLLYCLFFIFNVNVFAQEIIINERFGDLEIQSTQNGFIYVLNRQEGRLSRYKENGEFQFSVSGDDAKAFDEPKSLFVSSGLTVLICDYQNKRVILFDRNLQKIGEINAASDRRLSHWQPVSAVMNTLGEIWIFDATDHQIIRFDENGYIRSSSELPENLNDPIKLRLIHHNNGFWLIDSSSEKIYRFTDLGKYQLFFNVQMSNEHSIQVIDGQPYLLNERTLFKLSGTGQMELLQTIPQIMDYSEKNSSSKLTDWSIHQNKLYLTQNAKVYLYLVDN